jgi:hypothetical protein
MSRPRDEKRKSSPYVLTLSPRGKCSALLMIESRVSGLGALSFRAYNAPIYRRANASYVRVLPLLSPELNPDPWLARHVPRSFIDI